MAKPLLRLIWLFLSGTTPWKPKGIAFSSKTEVKGEQRAQNKKIDRPIFLTFNGHEAPVGKFTKRYYFQFLIWVSLPMNIMYPRYQKCQKLTNTASSRAEKHPGPVCFFLYSSLHTTERRIELVNNFVFYEKRRVNYLLW